MAYHEKQLVGSISAATMSGNLEKKNKISGTLNMAERVVEKDYEKLNNKPSINGVELIKDKSLPDIGIHPMTNSELLSIIKTAKGGI